MARFVAMCVPPHIISHNLAPPSKAAVVPQGLRPCRASFQPGDRTRARAGPAYAAIAARPPHRAPCNSVCTYADSHSDKARCAPGHGGRQRGTRLGRPLCSGSGSLGPGRRGYPRSTSLAGTRARGAGTQWRRFFGSSVPPPERLTAPRLPVTRRANEDCGQVGRKPTGREAP